MSSNIIALRSYQQEAIDAVQKDWQDGLRSVAVVLPTGSGKTVTFANMCDNEVKSGGKPLILVHRDELVQQAKKKIQLIAPDITVGVVKADQNETDAHVVVGSVQTLRKQQRLEQLTDITMIIIDECHHAAANSYVTITKHYPHARVVGFTATLQREDSKKLGDIFQKVSYQKDIEFGITHGFLCDVEGRTVEVPDLDLQSVNQRRGDFADEALAEALEESEAGKFIAEAYREHCPNRRGVLFAPNVATANLFANDLKDAGFSTEVIVGTTPLDERAEIYRRFEKGTTQILSSVGVLTEGWDAPWAHVAVIARPTRSQGLYTQMAGRVLRPWAGKDKALILDVVGAARQFPLATIADLSKTKPKIKDGETLGEALEREAKEKKPGRSTTGLKFEAIDLFHKSTSVWMQTYSGVWFIPVREATYFIWPEAETEWTVGRTPKYGRPERLRTGLDMALAMSWAEQLATDEDSSISSRKASWRRRKSVPTDAQKTTAARCGLDIAGKTKVEVSDMLSVYFASKLFPNGYPTY